MTTTTAKDPILEAALALETVRAKYEAVVNAPQPDAIEDRAKWKAEGARLGIEVSKADLEFAKIVDAERLRVLS
jgi:hypothetical protein